jgi:predicted phage terminase large subunit-like protein
MTGEVALVHAARKALAIRKLEQRREVERTNLLAFIKYFFQHEKGKNFAENWHYSVLAESLSDVLAGKCPRLIINVPPGSGKTELITKCFPVWALGNRPDLQIIATGYSTTLTQTYGSEARDYYQSETFSQVFPRRSPIREDTNTKGFWKNEAGGSYYATGTGGSITGNRANCVRWDTLIETENGTIRIEDLAKSCVPSKVLSVNHATGKAEYRRALAFMESNNSETYAITTSTGTVINCTGEHKFFVLRKGYVEAKDIVSGDKVIEAHVSCVREQGGKEIESVQSMLLQDEKSRSFGSLRLLRQGNETENVRCQKEGSKKQQILFLLKRVFTRSILRNAFQKVSSVWKENGDKDKEILRGRMQKDLPEKSQNPIGYFLRNLWGYFQAVITQDKVLRDGLQKRTPLAKNVRKRKLQIFAWKKLCSVVLSYASSHFRKGRKVMRNLWLWIKTTYSPCQSQSCRQQSQQSDNSVQHTSFDTPSLRVVTVSSVGVHRGKQERFYDIQVEGNSNFFANSVLVHNCFIIDDPIKPDESGSNIIRTGVNNWYDNTVLSRLFDPLKDSVIIIMQRTHEDDLCGYLHEKEKNGTGEKWRRIILPSIAEVDELPYRKAGEALQKNRYPLEALAALKLSLGPANFAAQYQQDPVDPSSREFHPEWFKYYVDRPDGARRVFTAVDPAFSQKDSADDSAIVTGAFEGDKLYILEITAGHLDPFQLENEIIRHLKVWRSEKVGIESVQAQQAISFSLKHRISKENIPALCEDIPARQDKDLRIRRLIPLYARGLIHHKKNTGWVEKLEDQLVKFPRGRHDDVIDALQYLYELYTLHPNTGVRYSLPTVSFDTMGRTIFN